ncbi:hypothetical protein ACFLWY_02235 [Chloroflexota bacterium]
MKVVCAWCGKEIGEKDGAGVEGVSHGICRSCFDEMRRRGEVGLTLANEEPVDGTRKKITTCLRRIMRRV